MTMFVNSDIEAAARDADGLCAKVLGYVLGFGQMIDRAGQGDFDGKLTEIEPFVATDRFRRLGSFMEEMDWETYRSAIAGWLPQAEWDGSFHRIAQVGNRVYLELEERTGAAGHAAAVNSMTVYEFGDDEKIEKLYVYLQQRPGSDPGSESGWQA